MKKTITILAALLLLSTTTALAAEYPTEVSATADNGIYEIRKTYELPAGQEPSEEIRQDFQQDGFSYVLTDLLRQELPQQQSRDYSETVTLDSESKELADVLPLLADTKTATTEDGFTGTLTLDASTITVEPAGYKTNSWTVTATRTYPNLSDMDMQYIPKTTTENGRTLSFASVDWQTDNTMNVDDYAIGDRYTAVVTYSGTASGKSVTGYTVTSRYSGTVEKIALDKVRYVAIFHGTPIQPEQQPIDWRYLAIPAGLLALIGAGFAVSKLKKKGTKQHEEIQDADYEQISEEGADVQPDAAGGDDSRSYPGVGT
ncbi:MAG: cell wall anchor protein [Oscillibacter sp.]|nr:cell wall anchor protein [Oscillibacter sp.]MEA4994750.1 cell wall anchor protein [Oscillibacter sp.]